MTTMQPLFLDHTPHFEGEEKIAGMLTHLGDNVDNWPQEVMQEAYKQIPYLAEFEPNVILDKIDEQKGFAFGSIEVRPKSSMTSEEAIMSGVEKVHIPIVVREQMLSPFDVFMHGRAYQHLTEGRLRAALFRPETMDAARTRPYDPSLVQDLQPPIRAGYGGFGSGGVKFGSAGYQEELNVIPVLPQLHGRVLPEHIERLKVACQDPTMKSLVTGADEGVRCAFNSAMGLTPIDLEKSAQVVKSSMKPTVVQLQKLADGSVKVKWANPEMYAPQQSVVPMDVAQDLSGEQDLAGKLETDGTLTASPDSPIKRTMEAEEVRSADAFGLWKVQDINGNSMIGWVFPQVLSLDLQPLPLALFNNGSQSALQEAIAGEMAGKSTDLPKGTPAGYGCLYYTDGGTARAFVPMTVTGTIRGPDGMVRYNASDDLGSKITFFYSDSMRKVIRVGESDYCIPTTVNWMPLRGRTELISDPMAFSKFASHSEAGIAELVGDRGVFSWRGPAVAKLASDQTKFLNRADAEFLGVLLGVSPPMCKEALDKAGKGQLMTFNGLRVITPFSEKMAAAHSQVRKALDELDPPIHNYFLAKEASLLDDSLTADKILGLGFLNAENISTFVEMLPAFEAAGSKLAEMLIAVRLGIKDIPEAALERMLVALEDVIRGLRCLQEKEVSFSALA
jgi:hypothetical protein